MRRRVWMYLLVVAAASFALTSLLHEQFSVTTAVNTRTLDSLFQDTEGPGQDLLEPQENQYLPSCSLRGVMRNDDIIRWRFNFSVPVFQWAASFNQSEWERLCDITPPYGWHGIPYEDVGSTLALLPRVCGGLFEGSSSRECVSCAVVGNGGILRGSKQGTAIDSHHYVFRLNGAITKGFEEDVGTKTSFYGFTTNSMKNSLRAYRRHGFTHTPQSPELKYIFIPSQLRDYVMLKAAILGTTVPYGRDARDRPSRYFGTKPTVDKFRILHPDFITYVVKRFLRSRQLKSKYGHLYMPSTGAMMLLTAIHTCDQVSAYGFITRNYASFSEHYYDHHKRALQFFSNHDLKMESLLWDTLHTHGIITLYQRD